MGLNLTLDKTNRGAGISSRGIWDIPGNEQLSWRSWDGDYVVFHAFSGQTHRLDLLSGEVLKVMMDGPVSAEVICTRVAAFLETDNDTHVAQAVTKLISGLEDAGLICSVG